MAREVKIERNGNNTDIYIYGFQSYEYPNSRRGTDLEILKIGGRVGRSSTSW